MEDSPLSIWVNDSQEGVDFHQPTPPSCGFHSIQPEKLDVESECVCWNPCVPGSMRAEPVPAVSDRTSYS